MQPDPRRQGSRATPKAERPRGGKGAPQPTSGWPENPGALVAYLVLGLLVVWMWQESFQTLAYRDVPYSAFKEALNAGDVLEARLHEQFIEGRMKGRVPDVKPEAVGVPEPPRGERGEPPGDSAAEQQAERTAKSLDAGEGFLFRTTRVEDPELVASLVKHRVQFVGVRPSFLQEFLVSWLLPIGLILLVFSFVGRRISAAGTSMLSFGRSRARLVADRDTGVTFSDVAGCDEAKGELQEVVDFLQRPERYRSLGAKIPKGVLLVGPPGTGKTLIARAVAGEARVPFFSLSGSDFVEMFVGVGAARVRDLFAQAKRSAPCIVFIDEIDAIGRQRGVALGASNDEREQTLNQLLVEMDGFEPNAGVILLAATNRPDVLDRALLRPGRFDRQVIVDAPDVEGREAILRVHARAKPLAAEVDLAAIARATPGFSGADLANVMNEAALLAARGSHRTIEQVHLEAAMERVVAGPERRSRRLSRQEKRRVAVHEVGHALVAAFSPGADPVHKISIVPRGRAALGYTLQLPEGQQFLLSRSELLDRLRVLLGGRAAETIAFDEVSTGAADDLERATNLARQMITLYGMGRAVGLMHCARPRSPLAAAPAEGSLERDCSESAARDIDAEVRQMLDTALAEARAILTRRRDALETIAAQLMERETIDARAFRELLGKPDGPQLAADA